MNIHDRSENVENRSGRTNRFRDLLLRAEVHSRDNLYFWSSITMLRERETLLLSTPQFKMKYVMNLSNKVAVHNYFTCVEKRAH